MLDCLALPCKLIGSFSEDAMISVLSPSAGSGI